MVMKNKLFDNNKNITSKKCPLSGKNAPKVDYKNIDLLKRYTTEKGKILPSRVTQVSTKKQRELSLAVKRARFLALLPYFNLTFLRYIFSKSRKVLLNFHRCLTLKI